MPKEMRPALALACLTLTACALTRPAKTPWHFNAPPPPPPNPAQSNLGGPLSEDHDEPVLRDYATNDLEDIEPPSMWGPGAPRQITLQWPLPTTGVTSLFGRRPDPIEKRERFHYGVDLEATYGAVVHASAAGKVLFAGWNAGHGRQIVLAHAGGYQTGYSHLAQVLVYEGTYVQAGQPIGFAGNSGRSTGPHLHFEVTRWGGHLDPLNLLGIPITLE